MACSYLFIFDYFLHFELFACNTTYKNESIHLNSWHHSHKKQKDGLETQVRFVDIFFHELEIPNIWGAGGCAEKCTSKQRKMVASFCEELLSENDFEAVLVNFYCYKYDANVSEAVEQQRLT